MKTASPKTVRVAVYVRQSVEDVTTAFGSIAAQDEAIRAFVLSQRSAGWTALPDTYKDEGFSGATMARPAFTKLLADVEDGRIDAIAVYRLDRLSRSFADFGQLVRLFDKHAVEFVSITEQFNTTSPAGRMLMNVLASFAEFERESIAQRTRDKMGAARRRGMWTGGRPLLGYDVVQKRLVVNGDEADQVRAIFALYNQIGSLMATVEVLNKRGWKTKSFTTAEGVLMHGSRFDKFNLRSILRSPIYVGRMRSGEKTFPGQHEAIIEEGIWNTTQELLTRNGRRGGCDRPNRHGVLLRGLVRCGACGSTMRHTFSGKGTTRYLYFVCAKMIEEGASACPRSRVRVDLIDGFVLDKVRDIGRDPLLARETIEAARAERERRIPELEAEVRRHEATARRAASERAKLVSAVANAGPASGTLLCRVAELDQDVGEAEQRTHDARDALSDAHAGTLDEDALRAALAEFDGIWNELFPRERARVLALLIEQVVFTGQTADVEVHFRANGLRSLNGAT